MQAGGGVVADSTPEGEYQEKREQGHGRDAGHRLGRKRPERSYCRTSVELQERRSIVAGTTVSCFAASNRSVRKEVWEKLQWQLRAQGDDMN